MSVEDDLSQNLDDISGLADQLVALIIAKDALAADLQSQITALVAGDAATAAKVQTAFDKSVVAENKLRAAVPGVPPVGGTPLLTSYANAADFRAAATAYTGPEDVTLDGTDVPTGTPTANQTGKLDYFTHSADGSVNTMGPTD